MVDYETSSRKARRWRKSDKWYLVKNPLPRFVPVTQENVRRYLNGNRWSKRG
jgi:hypothetical protein